MDHCCEHKAGELEQLQKQQTNVLWIVLAINAFMFVFEISIGLIAGSVALLADSLDMLGDTMVYGFSLFAIARSSRWKVRTALLKGGIMLVFGLAVLGQAMYRFFWGDIPQAPIMGLGSLAALAANTTCLLLLLRHRHSDLNMRSTWLCSFNDIIADTGTFLAAVAVYLTASRWPDLIMGLVITAVFLRTAQYVLREALAQLRSGSPNTQQLAGPQAGVATAELCLAGTCPASACQCP